MFDAEPVQQFRLPDSLYIDKVAIYPNDAPQEPHFEAIPFILKKEYDDGTSWFNEPHDFEVTDEYREAVIRRADVSADDLLLERNIPVTGFDQHDAI